MSFSDKVDYTKCFDLFQYAVLNPQIAILSFLNMANEVAKYPEKADNARKNLLNRFINLAEYTTRKMLNEDTCDLEVKTKDHRFDDPEWENNVALNILKQYYLSVSEWMQDCIDDVECVDRKLHQQTSFYVKQYLDALHPSNFPMLNPKVIRKTIEDNGKNIQKGFELFLNDLKNGAITTNDATYFSVGDNLANTKGKVIFKNYLIELIQYEATTKEVHKVPILFIPPWINKFYILDLGEENSLVKWLVDNGFSVFMISWVNPNGKYRDIGFDKYATDGIIKAIEAIKGVTNEVYINTVGYCIGGTLLSTLLAALGDKKSKIQSPMKIKSATLFTTLLDFEHAGDLGAFINDSYLNLLDSHMKQLGFMEGKTMYNTFSVLKSSDMIWRYMINNYMLGNDSPHHSTLFWNADCTNLTEKMHHFLAKTLYRDNNLKKRGVNMFGTNIDLSKIHQPIYMISTVKDHLVPWKATFDSLKLLDTAVRFVVGGSGHVAGIVNHPDKKKYCYWVNEKQDYEDASAWMQDAIEHVGSWWEDWWKWLSKHSGEMIPARKIGNSLYDAPGMYVHNNIPNND